MRGLALLYFFSGSAGLMYQIVWSRWLHEVFGVSVYAVTAVLTTFLGGLGLGSFLLGRVADARPNPLRFFGLLELGVGATALVGLLTIGALDPVHIHLANRLAPDSPLLLGARMLLAAAVILPVTVLMGGTLPAITRASVRRIGTLGSRLSILYALNTLGALAGTIFAGFFLIRAFGLPATLFVAVGLNTTVGIAALGLSRRGAGAPVEPPPAAPPARTEETTGVGLLVVMILAGVAALGLEVLWTRALVNVVGTTSYAFVTMLASFLLGVGLGGLLARAITPRVARLRLLFGCVQVGIAVTVLAGLPILHALGQGTWIRWLEPAEARWMPFVALRFGISALVMLVPTTLMGMTFPIAGTLGARSVRTLGGRIGRIYGANTLGNILGASIAAFVLLPLLGLQRGIVVLAAVSLAAGAWGLLPPRPERRGRARLTWSLPASGGVLVAVALVASWTPEPFVAHGEQPGDITRYYREGIVSTVKVVRKRDDERLHWMAVDGVKIGETHGGVDAKQQALASFPFLLREEPPEDVLTIGLGSGVLLGHLVGHPGVASAVCVELSPSVIEAARLFAEWNGNVLDDPRVTIVADDGVNYLRRSHATVDAIVSDAKSRTGHAGNAVFFSKEYYALCRAHLSPGGIFVQWIPLLVPPRELEIILRTFLTVFPEAYAWVAHEGCFVVGVGEPLVVDAVHVDAVLSRPAAREMSRHGWTDALTFASLLVLDPESAVRFVSGSRTINTLDHPVLEFYSLRAAEVAPWHRRAENSLALLEAARRHPPRVGLTGFDAAALQASREAALALLEGLALLERRTPRDTAAGLERIDAALALAPRHGMLQREAGRVRFEVGLGLQSRGLAEAAIPWYRRSLETRPDHALTHNNLGGALARLGDLDGAMTHFEAAVRSNPGFAGAHRNLALAFRAKGRFEEAHAHATEALRINPGAAID